MQDYLPLIQAMLSEWYLFTLNNALYAAVLATAVWLLTSMLYSIRIASLKRTQATSEKLGLATLTTAQQQLQDTQEELASTTRLMEKATSTAQEETQRALALEQLIYQRNKQVAEIIQLLATSFDLGERPLLASEDVKAELLWQQHAKVITQLIERLRAERQEKIELQQSCQAETAKLAEKEVLLEALQSTLDTHAQQLSKLELALAEQKTILQQQDNAQQVLSDTLKNYTPVVMKIEPAQAINTLQQPVPLEVVQEILPVQESPVIQDQIEVTPVEVVTAKIIPQAVIEQVAIEEPYATLDIEQPAVPATKGSFGNIKNLFGKAKPQPVKTEPQWADTQPEAPLPLATIEPQPANEASEKAEKKPGKLQGFYSKFRSKG